MITDMISDQLIIIRVVMKQFQRNSPHEDAKHLIKKLPLPSFDHSLSSFTSSRNELSKVHHLIHDDSPQQEDMSLFPANNDPSIILIDGNSIVDMTRKGKEQVGKQKMVEPLIEENNHLHNKVLQLSLLVEEYQRRLGQRKEDSDRKGPSEVKRLKSLIAEKDKKNIELFNVNKELVEELRLSKDESENKSKQLNSKTIELRKEREKVEALIRAKEIAEGKEKSEAKTEGVMQELARREIELRRLKVENEELSTHIANLNEELRAAKEHYLKEMREQTNRYKLQASQLLQKVKSQQSVSRSASIRGSNVSTSSLSESFSTQMLSPAETVQLIFSILKKISKSEMMQRILYSNPHFVTLLTDLASRKDPRRPN